VHGIASRYVRQNFTLIFYLVLQCVTEPGARRIVEDIKPCFAGRRTVSRWFCQAFLAFRQQFHCRETHLHGMCKVAGLSGGTPAALRAGCPVHGAADRLQPAPGLKADALAKRPGEALCEALNPDGFDQAVFLALDFADRDQTVFGQLARTVMGGLE
jgi:hypothetical protein